MKRILTVAAFVVLVVPAAYAAPPDGKGKPESPGKSQTATTQQQSVERASKLCKTERGTTAESKAAFREKYGTNKKKSNAFGMCVSTSQAKENAARLCKKERVTMGVDAFKAQYGGKANAFGKCVSSKVKKATET